MYHSIRAAQYYSPQPYLPVHLIIFETIENGKEKKKNIGE